MLIDPCRLQHAFPKCARMKSHSERACRSQVLRIKLSRWITKGKIRLSNQERVRITVRNSFWNVIGSFVNRPYDSCSFFLLCDLKDPLLNPDRLKDKEHRQEQILLQLSNLRQVKGKHYITMRENYDYCQSLAARTSFTFIPLYF